MRTLETLLLLADLLAFCFLAFPRMRTKFWIRLAPVLALAMAAPQVLVEGPRWQMAPAYALTTLFFLLWLLRNFTPAGEPTGRTRPRPMVAALAIGLGALGLAIAVALPMMVPVFSFAQPTGPYGIGTLSYHWVDASRSEVFAADPKERRQLMVQIWYPAKANPSAQRAAYMAQADAVTEHFSG